MKPLLLVATMVTLALAKPGLYKEKEDFQYSRSSTDEGTKAGFYGAQRGNMGGNYERAHNMDGLAQHQMGGLVRQVEGELGQGSKTRTGSVFTAANSRGVYGSGHYDLSNLEGRNFEEGVSYGDSLSQSQSQSSLTSQSGYNTQAAGYNGHAAGYNAHAAGYNAHAAGYNTHSSGYNAQSSASNSGAYSNSDSQGSRAQSGYNGYQYLGHNGVESNQQQAENLHATNQYDYGRQESTGYSQSAYSGQSAHDQRKSYLHGENSYGTNAQTRLLSGMPVKIILRPGTRVAVPIATQTYDSSNNAASSSSYNHNSVNSDAELLSTQHQHNNNYKPTGAKHYESSYSYRKEWEKHDTQPVTVLPTVPTPNPYPKNSELYEDAQSLSSGQQYHSTGAGSHRSHSHSSDSYGGHNANVNSASVSQSHHQTAYNALDQKSTSAAASDSSVSQGTYNSGIGVDTNNQIEDGNTKPKSYHSSYSYHKSWERQGDPYVIKPATSGLDTQASQRLTAATNNQGAWSSHRYGSRYQQAHQNAFNLEDCDCDENGHIRVARSYNTNQYEDQNIYQQNQYNQEALSQQSQNLEDLGQQTQNKWDKIEDLGQQSQNKWDQIEDLGQQTQAKWDKIEDLGQQSQSKWDNIEDLGQQTQNKWDKTEDLTQQTQNKWDQSEDLSQQTHNKWDQSEDLSQQAQNKWDQSENLGQQTQNKWDQSEDLSQQAQNKWDQSENLGQQTQNKWDQSEDLGQQTQNKWDQSEDLGQQTQNKWDQSEDLGQQTQTQWDQLGNPGQQTQTHWDKIEDGGQQTQTQWDHFDGQQSQLEDGQQLQNTWSQLESSGHSVGQETQSNWDNFPSQGSIPESATPNNKPAQHPLETESHTLSRGPIIPNEHNEYNKKPLTQNMEKDSDTVTSPKELPVQSSTISEVPQNPYNTNFNHPFISNNKHWEQSDNGNRPTSNYNNFNHPWFNQFAYNGEQAQNTNYYNQQSHMHNAWGSHWPSFPGSQPQNPWGMSTVNHQHNIEIKPQTDAQDTSKLWSLWNKVDKIEKQTISSNKTNTEEPQDSYFPHTNPIFRDTAENSDRIQPNIQHKPFINQYGHNFREPQVFNVEITTSTTKAVDISPIVTDNKDQKDMSSSDVGRGDIGPEDTGTGSTPQSNYQERFNLTPENKRYKTPAEIEALSQVLGDDKKTTDITENYKERNFTVIPGEQYKQNLSVSSTTSRPIIGLSAIHYENMGQYNGNTITVESGKSTDLNQSDLEKPVDHFEQENIQQQNSPMQTGSQKINSGNQIPSREQYDKPVHRVETGETIIKIEPDTSIQHPRQENIDTPVHNNKIWDRLDNGNNPNKPITKPDYYPWFHQLPHIPQKNEETPSTGYNNQQLNTYHGQELNTDKQPEKINQQNNDQQFENFEQQSRDLGQQSENFGQVDEHFGQQSEKFNEQFENFGQQSEKFDQQFETLGQQSENFGQESYNFGQQSENFGQQSENFGQQSQNFENQNNFGQHSSHFNQQFETFGQQSVNSDQNTDQQFETFGQQSVNSDQNTDQQFETFGQQSVNSDQNTDQQFETFGQKVDKFNKQDAEQEVVNLVIQKENKNNEAEIVYQNNMNSDQKQKEQELNLNNASPIEPAHTIQNIQVSSMHKDKQSEKLNQEVDLGHQLQTALEQHKNLDNKANLHETHNLEVVPIDKSLEKIEIPEDRAGKTPTVEYKDLTSISGDTPPETDNDKPGFWKSVGNKFVNAKDKVFSWFSRS